MKYEKMVKEILKDVGGKSNINDVYHCATRLRFKLKNESLANESAIKNISGVVGVIKAGGQFQIIIGTYVADVYKDLQTIMTNSSDENNKQTELKDAKEFKEDMKDRKLSSQFIDIISGVFTPILGLLMSTGVLKGILALCSATGILSTTSGTYQLLYVVSDCFFYYIPIFLGYTAMKKFGGTPFYGIAIGAALVYPSILSMMKEAPLYTLFSGTIFKTPIYTTFLGIPVMLMNYVSSVIPIILICYFAAKLEKALNNIMPNLIKSFAVPLLVLLISIILGFLVIGPIATFASDLLGAGISSLFRINATLCGLVYGALIQVCVVFGIHWGFVALNVNNLATLGYDPITICGMSSAFAQAGVVLMIMLRTKNKKLKEICGPAIISALFGITEPAIYGVTLQYKKPFIIACLASGLGGAIIGAAGVKQYRAGTNGLFGWMQVIPKTGFDSTVIASIIACLVSFITAIILMKIFEKRLDIDNI